MSKSVVYSRTRNKHGVIYGAVCHACSGRPVLIWAWDKDEVRAVGKSHAREHRRR